MRAVLAACLLLAPALASGAGPAADPLAVETAAIEKLGFALARRVDDKIGGVPVAVLLFRDSAQGRSLLRVYAVLRGKPLLTFVDPALGGDISLDETLGLKRLPDLFRDGSRALIYRTGSPAQEQATLNVLRFDSIRPKRAGSFPDGRLQDLRGDGGRQIVVRTWPLGHNFFVRCGPHTTMVAEATRTDLLAWRKGRFVSVSGEFPDFYAQRIAADEDSLRALDPEKRKRPAIYAGQAVTLLLDYESKGEGRRGWTRLDELFTPPPLTSERIIDCIDEVKKELRQRLRIPKSWG